MVRLERPRKSIFRRPMAATCSIAYWVVGMAESPPRLGRCRGTCSMSGSREITTPAAWVLA
jgi:hypothetical protein